MGIAWKRWEPGVWVWSDSGWSGNQLVSGTPTDGCDCYDVVAAPAGQYRVKVPFYRSITGMLEDEPVFECTVPFDLPDPDGAVEVVLNSPGADCVAIEP